MKPQTPEVGVEGKSRKGVSVQVFIPPHHFYICFHLSFVSLLGMNSSKTKLELQKHLTTLTNQEQAMIFEEVQVQY